MTTTQSPICASCGHRRNMHKVSGGCEVEQLAFLPGHGDSERRTFRRVFCLCRKFKASRHVAD